MLYALIVIYNKKCNESNSLKFIEKHGKDINIVVFDNSTSDYGNKEYCKNKNITYYTLNRNIGLSKAYNYVIEKIEKNDSNYLLILDDDTQLNDSYIEEVKDTIRNKEDDVLLPRVYSKEKLISPATFSFRCRVVGFKEDEKHVNKITAINSGMVVKTSVYNKTMYNEELFLDYVDHDFMKRMKDIRANVYVMQSSIEQNFSRFQKNNVNSEKIRCRIYLKDFKKYCKNCNNLLFYYLSSWKYRFHEALKYHDVRFLFIK